MKIFRTLTALVAAAATLTMGACEDTTQDIQGGSTEVELTVNPETIELAADGIAQVVTIETNADTWDFVVAASWLNVEKSDNTLTLSAQQNSSKESREGEVVISAEINGVYAYATLPVKQLGGNGTTTGGDDDFECAVFLELMLEYCDADGDGQISDAEAAAVTEMVLTMDDEDTREPITSLKGIRRFVNLESLDCDCNNITSLDLSGMEKLVYVDCSYNLITDLNIEGCTAMKWVYCYSNKIKDVNIEGCPNIMFFQAYKNNLTKLDFSDMPELVYFDVRLNDLNEVDFSNCPKLQVAAVGTNNIMSLNLEGLPSLYTLGCYENNIATLDLSKLTNLEMLECYSNNLAELDLSANSKLIALTCQRNLLKSLNIEGCNLLKKFDCSVNYLSGELDMSNYPQLTTLNCGANSITAIDVAECTAMTSLTCDNTQITELNVSTLPLLEALVANDCMLKVMDCSNNLSLKTLHLQGNPLEELILSQSQGIADLKVDNFDVITYKE